MASTQSLVSKVEWLVVHKLEKQKNGAPTVVPRPSINKVDKKSVALIEKLYEAYRKKSRKSFGKFEETPGTNGFQKALDDGVGDPKKVYDFSVVAMNILKSRIASYNLATGGFVLFTGFATTAATYLGVFILSDHEQYLISPDKLEVNETKTIDITKIHLGCLVSLQQYKSRTKAPDLKYLSFVAGRDEITKYFQEFIGCAGVSNEKTNARELRAVADRFFDYLKLDAAERRKRKEALYEALVPAMSQGAPVNLKMISGCISNPDDLEGFTNYLAAEEPDLPLDDELTLDRNAMRGLKTASLKKSKFSLTFDRDLLETGIIVLDKAKGEIKINGLSVADFTSLE